MKYQLVTYFTHTDDDLEIEPGIDQRLDYDDLEKAKLAAALACTLDLHDGAIVWDRETGEICETVGDEHCPGSVYGSDLNF